MPVHRTPIVAPPPGYAIAPPPASSGGGGKAAVRIVVVVAVVAALAFAGFSYLSQDDCSDFAGYSYEKKAEVTRDVVEPYVTIYGDTDLDSWITTLGDYCAAHPDDDPDDLRPSFFGF